MIKWDLFQEYKDGFTLGSPLMWLTTLKWEKSDGYFMDAKKTSDRKIMSILAGINMCYHNIYWGEKEYKMWNIYMKEIIKLHYETSGSNKFLYYLIFFPMSLYCFL